MTAQTNGDDDGDSRDHDFDGIELADAIESVRDQLLDAATRATGRPLAFEVGDIEMEFTLELRKEVKGGLKVRAWVVEAGADGARTSGHTHKVAFTLKPRDARTGAPWQVGNPDRGSTAGFGRAAR
ncbi:MULTISPECIES: trypco2 family protein [unclassified Streptomyces]|uniref:trypco2 family protein n=1 Tax=unclassified Streptomyces TaxID=2593676 RepID=UPI002E2A8552|nr:trypco2 family protein [Streptomyces sp. NBC_01429]